MRFSPGTGPGHSEGCVWGRRHARHALLSLYSTRHFLSFALAIREIPDHATFREKEHTLGWLDKLGFFSLFALIKKYVDKELIYMLFRGKF